MRTACQKQRALVKSAPFRPSSRSLPQYLALGVCHGPAQLGLHQPALVFQKQAAALQLLDVGLQRHVQWEDVRAPLRPTLLTGRLAHMLLMGTALFLFMQLVAAAARQWVPLEGCLWFGLLGLVPSLYCCHVTRCLLSLLQERKRPRGGARGGFALDPLHHAFELRHPVSQFSSICHLR